jgi:hypothetical protein
VWQWSHRIGGAVALVLAGLNTASGAEAIVSYSQTYGQAMRTYWILLGVALASGGVGLLVARAARSVVATPILQPPAKVLVDSL